MAARTDVFQSPDYFLVDELLTEVENFVKTDSAVITGRLIMKYYPWWAGKGKYIFK